MAFAFKKLCMLEKIIEEQEKESVVQGYTTSPVDKEFRDKIQKLMEKVRTV